METDSAEKTETLDSDKNYHSQNYHSQNYHSLNAMLNLFDDNGLIQFDKDREAVRQYFLQHVNQNTVFFHDLEEKIDYLVRE